MAMTRDEQELHLLIEQQRARGVPETSIVSVVGLVLGFGRLMQLTEQAWRELEIQRDTPGTEFTVGPCARELVPCPHPEHGLSINGHCDWCCGEGRVTARVLRAIKEVDAATADIEAETETKAAPALILTLPQTIFLLTLSRGAQPPWTPTSARRPLLREKWIKPLNQLEPGARERKHYEITAAGRQALAASPHLSAAQRKLDEGKRPGQWQGLP